MDSSFLKLAVPTVTFASAAASLAVSPARLYAQQTPGLPVSIVAEGGVTLDGSTNTYTFRRLRIDEADLMIAAERGVATRPDAERSEWRIELEGDVRLQAGSALIRAQRAVFSFAADQLSSGELSGDPAVFEDLMPDSEGPVRGTASRIHFDESANIVRMEGEVSFTLGPNRIQDCDLVYDLDQERVDSGSADSGNPCTITIVPPDGDADDRDAAENGNAQPP